MPFMKPNKISARGLLILTIISLSACVTAPSRYQQSVDSTPEPLENIAQLPMLTPEREPLSRRGNASEYEVWGKTYYVQKGIEQYSEEGIASWYGQKFHGHETSNGEIFDVYQFTAAHKTLPLPSYVKVTNLRNQRSLIVRVNDRGPFHGDRLIDLSYAAAVKLGFQRHGTANVKIELLAAPLMPDDYLHIQVEAFRLKHSAEQLKNQLQNWVAAPVYIAMADVEGTALHKVRIGPVAPDKVESIQATLESKAINTGIILPNYPKPKAAEHP